MESFDEIEPKKRCLTLPMSELADKTINPIRQIIEAMKITPNPENELISLSIGDPTIFGNLPPADETSKAVSDSLSSQKYNGYAPSLGYQHVRQAVADFFTLPSSPLTDKDVVIASGCSGAIELVLTAMMNKGDNCLIPMPGFSLYKTICGGNGFETKSYKLLPDKDWEIDLDHLESLIDDKTRCIVVNNPSNPCGSVFRREHLQDILKVAERHHLPILCDEIYAFFVFPGREYHPIASLTTTVPVLSVGAISKRYLVPGWRLGWILIHDRNGILDEVRTGIARCATKVLGACTIIQGALPDILKNTPQSFFDRNIEIIHNTAKIAFDRLSAIPGINPIMPGGAMYMMVGIDRTVLPQFESDIEFTEELMREQSVFCLPGTCFQFPSYFRIVLTVPLDLIETACERISRFCHERHRTGNGH